MSQTPRRRGRAGEVLRGLGAVVGLAVLVAAVPYGLWRIDGSPLPSSLPDLQDITDTLTSRDDGSFFVSVLILAGWIGWATFAVAVLVEIPAAIRGVRAPRMPALSAQQRLAAGLITAISAMLAAGPVAAGSAIADEHAGQPTSVQHAQPPVTVDSLQPPAADEPPKQDGSAVDVPAQDQTDRYVVQPGDTLWDISDRKLDDPTRYPEIVEASADTVQPDGRRLTDPDLIIPGWELVIPAESDAGAVSQSPDRSAAGDNTDQTAPPTTGQDTTTPDTETEPEEVPDAGKQLQGGAGKAAPDTGGGVGKAAPDTGHDRGWHSVAEADVAGHLAADTELDTGALVRTGAGVGALLAAGVVGLLTTRRAVQQRRRRAGQRVPEPDPAQRATEIEFRQVADTMSVQFVDRALRTLTAKLAETGAVLPPVRAARLVQDQFELYLAEPAQLPAPFEGTSDQGVWVLATSAADVLSAEDAEDYPAPYPSLVTLGHDTEDAHLMVDLEHLGSLGVEGDPAQVRAFMTALAGEYATSTWADDIRVTLVGDHVDLEALDTGRVRHVMYVEHLLDELAARARQDRQLMANSGAPDLATARASHVAAAAWTPEIVLVATTLTPTQRERLTSLVSEVPRVAITTVTTDVAQAEWTLRFTSEPDWAVLDPMTIALRPQLLDAATYQQLLGVVATASEPPAGDARPELSLTDIPDAAAEAEAEAEAEAVSDDLHDEDAPAVENAVDPVPPPPPGGPAHEHDDGEAQPHEPVSTEVAEETADPPVPAPVRRLPHQPPRILMLGPVDIENPAGDLAESSKRGQSIEIAVFLSLRPGVDGAAMDDALWAGRRKSRNTRNTAVSRLRRWLGTSPDHEEYLPRMEETYRLHPDVRSDWRDFQDLIPDGPAAAETSDLRAALAMVRGMPLSGRGARRYAWADGYLQDMVAAIVDVSHELAQRALGAGDFVGARRAATRGLEIEPVSELLWRDRLKAEARVGTRDSVDALVDELRDIAEQCGGDLEPETVELIDALQSAAATRSAS